MRYATCARKGCAIEPASCAAQVAYLQPLFAVEPVGPLAINHEAFGLQHLVQRRVAVTEDIAQPAP